MWARNLELLLAAWLACSPWIFARTSFEAATDLACATALGALAWIARRRPDGHAHLLELVVALVLVVLGRLDAPAPGAQNQIAVGLLVGLVAIVPSEASRPPRGWRVPPPRRGTS